MKDTDGMLHRKAVAIVTILQEISSLQISCMHWKQSLP